MSGHAVGLPMILRTADLQVSGLTTGADLVRVRHGFRMKRQEWEALPPERRHAALVVATDRSCRNADQIFCRASAAALWGLPRIGPWPNRVQILVPDGPRRDSPGIQRHRGRPDRILVLEGVRVTTPARTVVDLARFETVYQAVVATDHALRQRLCTREELLVELAGVGHGERGRRRAALVCAMADGRSMSPGESLSRVQMMMLRLPRPDLQVKFCDRGGLIGYVDFGWEGVVGEFDGRVKYRAQAVPGESVEEILWQEKLREDRLRQQVDVVRWTWTTAMDRSRLARTLAGKGILPQRQGWFGRDLYAEVA